MKKLTKILPVCGFAIAVALVGVTSAFKEAPKGQNGQTLYRFMYDLSSPNIGTAYSETSVEDERNWTYAPEESCPSGTVKACTIEASQVDLSNPAQPELLQAEAIDADTNPAGVAHVTSTADGSGSTVITNKAN